MSLNLSCDSKRDQFLEVAGTDARLYECSGIWGFVCDLPSVCFSGFGLKERGVTCDGTRAGCGVRRQYRFFKFRIQSLSRVFGPTAFQLAAEKRESESGDENSKTNRFDLSVFKLLSMLRSDQGGVDEKSGKAFRRVSAD